MYGGSIMGGSVIGTHPASVIGTSRGGSVIGHGHPGSIMGTSHGGSVLLPPGSMIGTPQGSVIGGRGSVPSSLRGMPVSYNEPIQYHENMTIL